MIGASLLCIKVQIPKSNIPLRYHICPIQCWYTGIHSTFNCIWYSNELCVLYNM